MSFVYSFSPIRKLANSIRELRTEIECSSFSPGVKEYLLRHLSIIEAGIQDYAITGASSITEAFHEGFRAAANAEPVESPVDRAGFSKVIGIWKVFWNTTKEVVHLDRVVSFVGTKIEQGAPLLEWVRGHTIGGP